MLNKERSETYTKGFCIKERWPRRQTNRVSPTHKSSSQIDGIASWNYLTCRLNFWQNSAINQSQRKSIQKPLYSKMLYQENNCPLQISMLIDLKYSFYIRLFTRECYLEYTKLFFIWIKSWKLYFYNGYLVPLKGDVQLMSAMHKINFFIGI